MPNGHTFPIKHLGVWGSISFFLFCASTPLLFPIFDIWRSLVPSEVVSQAFFPSASFYDALPLAAMFTALAYLFICLLKTEYARIGRRVLASALVCYIAGCLVAHFLGIGLMRSELAETICGLAMGYGGAVMALFWISNLHVSDLPSALLVSWIAALALFLNAALMALLDESLVRICLTLEMLLSIAGCVWFFLGHQGKGEQLTQGESNWWDVFGRLDVSVLEGTDDFEKPSARALFLAVVPAIIFLLLMADIDLARGTAWGITPMTVGGLVAIIAIVPLLRMKSDQALINFSYRFFLPLIAFAAFALAVFVDSPQERSVMIVGAFAFCTVYTILMLAMFFAMAGRMRSLALPVASMMIIAGGLVCILSNARGGFDVLEAYRYRILVVLLVVAVIVLSITPSSRLWRVVLDGIDAVKMNMSNGAEDYIARCTKTSEEYGLTAREAEILLLLGRGHTSAYIAKELIVAESTVRSHRKNIYRKLEVSSREELFNLLDKMSKS